MQFIQGNDRFQTFFITLEEQVAMNNTVRLMDAFVDILDLKKLDFLNTIHRSEGRPPYAPTVLLKRIIQRIEYQDAVDINDNNIRQNPQYYKRRQAICEHPFGSIKRQGSYTYTLLESKQKVNAEMNLIMLCYNFMRTINIMGFQKMMEAIQCWSPDYKKVAGCIIYAIIKTIYSQNKQLFFERSYQLIYIRIA